MRILVTGGSGYIGSRFLKALAALPDVEEVVDVDIKPPRESLGRVRYENRSVTEDLTDLVASRERPVDVVCHLAWNVDPLRDPVRQRDICIGGTRRVLEACAAARTPHLLFVSSATAYGANPIHTRPLSEVDPLREHYHFQYSAEKREAEHLCRRFAEDRPGTILQVVRPAVVGGPNVSNFLFRTLDRPVTFRPVGYDPVIQLVHEDDVARALCAIVRSRVPGAWNLAGEGDLTFGDVSEIVSMRVLALPFPVMYRIMDTLWKLGVTSMTEAPADFLYFLRYPWLVSTRRIEQELSFRFQYTGVDVLRSYLASRGRLREDPSRSTVAV